MNDIELWFGDCLKVMLRIPDKSVDMILADLPYGTTACKWDTIISFEKLWEQYNRISKNEHTPILLFGNEPFSSLLRISNIINFRYDWIIEKTHVTGFLNANKMPMKSHEIISVFYKKLPVYSPQKTFGHPRRISTAEHKEKTKSGGKSDVYHIQHNFTDYDSTERFPRDVLKFKWDKQLSGLHPTQKPVSLLEYMIKTYTNEGDLVLDNTMGSGSTGVACKNTNRRFIGIENNLEYFEIAKARIDNAKGA